MIPVIPHPSETASRPSVLSLGRASREAQLCAITSFSSPITPTGRCETRSRLIRLSITPLMLCLRLRPQHFLVLIISLRRLFQAFKLFLETLICRRFLQLCQLGSLTLRLVLSVGVR